MLPPCSTLQKLITADKSSFFQYAGKNRTEEFFIAYIFVTQREKKAKKKKTLICSLFICWARGCCTFISSGAGRRRRLTRGERCAESRRVAGRRSVSAPTVRIWEDRYINVGPIKYGECNLWKWQIILSMLSGNCRRCIIGAVSETNTGGELKSACGQQGVDVCVLLLCAFLCVYPFCHDGMKLLLTSYSGALHLLGSS